MEFSYVSKFFRNCNNSYDLNTKDKESGFHKSKEEHKEQKEPWLKARYLAVFTGFMAEFFLYLHRITISMSIVAMANSSTVLNETDFTSSKSCPNLIEKNQDMNEYDGGEFLWSPKLQGYILGSSFICYIIALPILSKLAEMYGSKRILLFCIFFPSLFTFLSPFAARWNVYALIVVQILRGICQGGVLPAEAILIANWCPKQERGYSYTIAVTGSSVGAVIGSYLTGALCGSTFLGGWPSAFYVNGSLGLIMSILLWFFLYDNPSIHPSISPVELEYILQNQENALTQKRPKTPWKKLLTSVPVYALSYSYFGSMWGMSHFLSNNPTFLKTILHYSIEQDGLFNALPFLLQILTSQFGGILSSLLNRRNYMSVDKARKFMTLLSSLGYSGCVLGIYFADCNRTLSIILSLGALSSVGFSFAGSWVVSTDMSPTFAGSINAFACTIGSLPHFLMPVIVGYLTNGSQTIEQWHKIFLICIGISLTSGLVFTIFGSAEIQPWNEVPDTKLQELTEEKTRH